VLCLRSREPLGNRAASAWGTSIAEKHFASTDKLVVDPDAILVADGFRTWTGRARKQAHARGRLKHIGAEGAAVAVEFDAQIAGFAEPGNLVAGVQNNRFRENSHQNRTVSHGESLPFTGESTKPGEPRARDEKKSSCTNDSLTAPAAPRTLEKTCVVRMSGPVLRSRTDCARLP